MKTHRYQRTLAASYIGCISQAIVNNLPPLLFLTFQRQFNLGLGQVAFLITLNFGVQLLVDAVSTLFADRAGYRRLAVAAHLLCAAGLACLGILPGIMPAPYLGLVVAIILNALGGGLIEVIISPIVEALPSAHKSAAMSMLHSFYCWGVVLVIVVSTLFFNVVGIAHWRWLCLLWAALPLANSLLFTGAPVNHLIAEGEKATPLRQLLQKKMFILFLVVMVCAGASEQAMSQWASLFAESGLGVGKTMGDLLGPCVFAVLMGLTRLVLGLGKLNWKLENTLIFSASLCIFSYLLTVFAPNPILSLVGCGLCGLSVGAMWPATFSLASRALPKGGAAMFALFALAGDLGCAAGPALVGLVGQGGALAPLFGSESGGALKAGLFVAIGFPLVLWVSVMAIKKRKRG